VQVRLSWDLVDKLCIEFEQRGSARNIISPLHDIVGCGARDTRLKLAKVQNRRILRIDFLLS
jgi:hypothetical protein